MPLRGEAAARPTYVNLERLPDGTALVHRCEHAILGKKCAQKTIRLADSSIAGTEPRLLEELDHPHITPVREAQFDPNYDGCITFVMPWYDGGSAARALIDGYRYSLNDAVGVVLNMLSALDYLHTVKRYVHRDVKTANLLLDAARSVGYLSDFGLAATLGGDGTAQAVLSTYEYMAPECAATGRHGPAADVYSAGIVLFELLNGRIRWEELDRPTIEQRVTAGRRALPDSAYSASAFAPHVPDHLVRITRKAIAAKVQDRFATAATFLRALKQVTAIDWRPHDGQPGELVWIGTWPPQCRREDRDEYRVTVRTMTRGPSAGQWRVVAHHRRVGAKAWRRTLADRDVAADDAAALRRFFADVAASAAHRHAAR